MKKLYILATLSPLLVNAATLTSTAFNSDGNTDFVQIESSAGIINSTSNAAVYVGTFNETALTTATTVSDLFAAFTPLGRVGGTTINPWNSNFGIFSGDAVGDATALNGSPVYVFVANNNSVSAATEALIWKSNSGTFINDANPTAAQPQNVLVTQNSGNAVFGSFTTATGNGFGGSGTYLMAAPNAVPEPSATLLFAGSLTLLGLRRRRA